MALGPAITMTITLAGRSMIRGDIRVDVPDAVPIIRSLVDGIPVC